MVHVKIESKEYDTIHTDNMKDAKLVLEGMVDDGVDMYNDVRVIEVYERFEFTYTGLDYLCMD